MRRAALRSSSVAGRLRSAPEVHHVRRVGARRRNVDLAVAVQIRDREAVHRSLAVTHTDRVKLPTRSAVEVDRRWCLDVSDENVDSAIAVQIANGERVRDVAAIANGKAL